MRTPSLGRLIDNIGALVLRQLTTWSLTTLLIIFLPRYLGDAGLGKTTFATGVLAVLVVATDLGTSTYMVKRISVRRGEWSDIFWNACLIRGLLAGLALAAMLPLLAGVGVEMEMRHLLYLTGVTLVVASLQNAASATIVGLEKMRWLTVAEIANKLIVTVIGVAALLAGYRVVTFGAIVLLGASVALVVDLLALLRMGLQRPRFSRLFTHLLIRGGIPFLIAGAIKEIYPWIDVGALQALTRASVVGWYGAALQLCTTLNFLPFILTTAMLPPLSRLFIQGHQESFISLARQAIRLVLLTSLPIAVGMMLIAGHLIRFLGYPSEFHQSVPVLVLLAGTLPANGLLMVTSTIVVSMDKQAAWVKLMAFCLTLNLVLNIALIELFQHLNGNGGIGAATASLIAETIQLTIGLRFLPKGVLGSELYTQAARAIGATAIMALAVLLGRATLGLGLFPTVALGAFSYGAASVLLRAVDIGDVAGLAKAWSLEQSASAAAELLERTPSGAQSA